MATKAAEKPKSDKARADEAPAAEDPTPKKRSKKKIFFLLLLSLVLIGGGSAALYSAMQPAAAEGEEVAAEEEEEASTEEEKKAPPVFVTLENFLVNLRDDDGDHYLQLGLVFEVSDQQAVDEVKLQMPRVRNGILLLLSSKQSSEISSVEGKQKLIDEILTEARKPMNLAEPAKGIEGVYFSAFVIQ